MPSWWERVWRKKHEDWTFAPIPASQVMGGSIPDLEVPVDDAYITITMQAMRIPLSREWWTKYFGVVHSFSHLLDRRSGTSEFHVVTTPTKLESVDRDHMDFIIMGKRHLLGPVVYRGGLALDIGLFSVAATDLAAPYISLLETLSKTAGVAFVGAASPIIGTIKTGMELLAGKPGRASLEIGYSGDIPNPRAGHYMLARIAKATISPADLGIDQDGRLLQARQLVTTYPYVVFTIEVSEKRDDWFMIPEISKAYQALREAVARRDSVGATAAFEAFKVACLLSDDLVTEHARKLVEKVQSQMALVLPATMTGARADVIASNLPELKNVPLYENV